MDVKLIAGVSENRVIGIDGELPWHFPEDLAHFQRETMDSVVIMGRVTFENIVELNNGEPLVGRESVVLTGRESVRGDEFDRVHLVSGVEEALRVSRSIVLNNNIGSDVYVAGGGSVYEQFIGLADELVLTEVDMVIDDGDVFFPVFDDEKWRVVSEETGFDGFSIRWYRCFDDDG